MNDLCICFFALLRMQLYSHFSEERLLDQRINKVCLVLLVIAKFPSVWVVSGCPCTSSVWRGQFPHNLAKRMLLSSFWIFDNLLDMEWCLSVVLMCISLIIKEVGLLFMFKGHLCILTVNFLFLALAYFSVKVLVFFFPSLFKIFFMKESIPLLLIYY